MLQIINNTENAVAFQMSGDVTAAEYKTVIAPAVKALLENLNEINFLLFLDTNFQTSHFPLWFEDALIGLRNFGKWNRAAIVTDSPFIESFTRNFSYIVSGELRSYPIERLQEAIGWVSGREIPLN